MTAFLCVCSIIALLCAVPKFGPRANNLTVALGWTYHAVLVLGLSALATYSWVQP